MVTSSAVIITSSSSSSAGGGGSTFVSSCAKDSYETKKEIEMENDKLLSCGFGNATLKGILDERLQRSKNAS